MKVRIELRDVVCHNSEDVCDTFYVLSACWTEPERVHVGLTTPLRLCEHESVSFTDRECALFDAVVPDDEHIRGGLVAFAAHFSRGWEMRGLWIDRIKTYMAEELRRTNATGSNGSRETSIATVSPCSSATVLAAAVRGWYLVAPKIAEDDELGQITLDAIPARGAALEEACWDFKWSRSMWSNWGYTVRYQICRS